MSASSSHDSKLLADAAAATVATRRSLVDVYGSADELSDEADDRIAAGSIDWQSNTSLLQRRAVSRRISADMGRVPKYLKAVMEADVEVSYHAGDRVVVSSNGERETSRTLWAGWRDLDDPAWWMEGIPDWLRDLKAVARRRELSEPVAYAGVIDLAVASGDPEGLVVPQKKLLRRVVTRGKAARQRDLSINVGLSERGTIRRFSYVVPDGGKPSTSRQPFWVSIVLTDPSWC